MASTGIRRHSLPADLVVRGVCAQRAGTTALPMNGTFCRLTRDLHLHLGLFASPFVLVFAVSVFYFVHAWDPKARMDPPVATVAALPQLPAGLNALTGHSLVEALQPVLATLGVPGEIGFVRHVASDDTFVIPVSIPGREATVTLDLPRHEARVVTRDTGLADAFVTLHKSPGPHGPGIRMNWWPMKAWRWFADATACLVLFITASGVYLWHALRAERRIGRVLILAGASSFLGLAYVLCR
jgi:hypothetical protein